MAILRRFLCWNLRTAVFVGLVQFTVTAFFALMLRALDLAAIGNIMDFQISQGFRTPWRSHQWQAFLASDIILVVCHVVMLFFTLYMLYMVTQRHFVMYVSLIKNYSHCLMFYMFVEFAFSCFEFSFYGLNTFRLAFVVFIWLYWLARLFSNMAFALALVARTQEMEDEMAMELRFSDKKYMHSYM